MRFRLMFAVMSLSLLVVAKDKEKPSKAPAWPPKAGVKTPGIQIPFANLKAEAEVTLEGLPAAALSEGPNLLVALRDKGAVARLATRDNKLGEAWKGFEEPCGGMVSAFGHIWVPDCKKQSIARVEARGGKIAATVEVGVGKSRQLIAATADSVWVLSDDKGTLARIDPTDNSVVSELRLDPTCGNLVYEQNALWLTCTANNKLIKVNAKTNLVDQRIDVAAEPTSILFAEEHLWVLGNKEGKISKVDPKTNKVVATIETGVPGGNGSLAFGEGAVWASATGYPLTRIDAKNDKVLQQFAGEAGGMVKFAAGSVWLINPAKMTVSRFDPKRIALTIPD